MNSPIEKQLAQKLSITTVVGCVVWVFLLLHGAAKVHDRSLDTHYFVQCGPLQLNELSKIPVGDHFVVSLSFKPGIVLFFLLCWVIGVLWAITKKKQ